MKPEFDDFELWEQSLDDGCRLAWLAFELALQQVPVQIYDWDEETAPPPRPAGTALEHLGLGHALAREAGDDFMRCSCGAAFWRKTHE